MNQPLPKLAIIGGTGALGSGLAKRWAQAGYPVIIGSRSSEKASLAAEEITSQNHTLSVIGTDNHTAAVQGEVIVIAVPFSSHAEILHSIKDTVSEKIVVDTTVPLKPPKVGTVQLPEAGSAAIITQQILGAETKVVSALHNVAAHKLHDQEPIDCDVLVCGNIKTAREVVIGLIEALGMRGLHAGPIANSVAIEAMTSVLITINRFYKVADAGFKITGDLISGEKENI